MSIRLRKLIEEVFGCIKGPAGQGKKKVRRLQKNWALPSHCRPPPTTEPGSQAPGGLNKGDGRWAIGRSRQYAEATTKTAGGWNEAAPGRLIPSPCWG